MEKDLAVAIAEKILETYSVGDFSRFCDGPAEFDSADADDIAELIRPLLPRVATQRHHFRMAFTPRAEQKPPDKPHTPDPPST